MAHPKCRDAVRANRARRPATTASVLPQRVLGARRCVSLRVVVIFLSVCHIARPPLQDAHSHCPAELHEPHGLVCCNVQWGGWGEEGIGWYCNWPVVL